MTHSAEAPVKKAGWQKGKKRTAENRSKISASLLGKTHTLESRAKMSRAKIGTRLTDTHRANIVAGLRARRRLTQQAKTV